MKNPQIIIDRYTIDHYTMSELMDAYQDDAQAALDAAITQAAEKTRLYVTPCTRKATLNTNGTALKRITQDYQQPERN